MSREKDDSNIEHVEPCCESCRHEIEQEPQKALLIMERCLFETRVTEYQTGGTLSWD